MCLRDCLPTDARRASCSARESTAANTGCAGRRDPRMQHRPGTDEPLTHPGSETRGRSPLRGVPRSAPSRLFRLPGGLRACFVAAKPHWVQPIEDVELAVEDSLTWQCRAGGKPTPSYRWLKDGAALALEVRPRPASPPPPPARHTGGCLASTRGRKTREFVSEERYGGRWVKSSPPSAWEETSG